MNNNKAIKFKSLQFLTSDLNTVIESGGFEIALAGRSNSGKSSVINTLAGVHNLARTSSTPGKTQNINFYCINQNKKYRLADLPGYGYAKVQNKQYRIWENNLADYIVTRNELILVIIVMDIRHPLKENDLQMVNLCHSVGIASHLLLSKADKLTKNQISSLKNNFEKKLHDFNSVSGYSIYSAHSKIGVVELRKLIMDKLIYGK